MPSVTVPQIPTTGPLAPPQVASVQMKANDTQADLLHDLSDLNVEPLWTRMAKLNPPLPAPKAIVHKWDYEAIRPQLIRAGNLVTEKEAERRVLMLINPAMGAPNTTDTLYAGLQMVMPGETAAAHRHSAFACRFIIEGDGGFTAIQGRRIKMHRGDFILTPTWHWHDHGNDSAASPMIWLDGLDLPNHQYFPCHFVQHYALPRYPAEDAPKTSILYPWKDMQARLDADLDRPYALARYYSQTPGEEGQEVSKVIGAQCERIRGGHSSPSIHETSSAVYHVIDGSGHSKVGEKTVVWKKGDTFTVPAWHAYEHTADEDTYLYRFDDMPMIRAVGLYRNSEDDFLERID